MAARKVAALAQFQGNMRNLVGLMHQVDNYGTIVQTYNQMQYLIYVRLCMEGDILEWWKANCCGCYADTWQAATHILGRWSNTHLLIYMLFVYLVRSSDSWQSSVLLLEYYHFCACVHT